MTDFGSTTGRNQKIFPVAASFSFIEGFEL
jgi:hypothetical protein